MKNKIILIIIFFLNIILFGENNSSKLLYKHFSSGKLNKDLSFLIKSLEEIHPDIYKYISKETFEREHEKVKNLIKDEMTIIEFFNLVAPLISLFKDGHTVVNIPFKELYKFTQNGGRIFPFDVDCSKGRILVTETYSSKKIISVGTEIIEINGISSKEILNKFVSITSGYKREYRLLITGDLFSMLLYIVYNMESDFDLKFILNKDDKIYQKKVIALSIKEINIIKRSNNKERNRQYSYIPLLHKKIGIIDIRSFSDKVKFCKFLYETFKDIKEKGIKNLVIDIRNNSGGDSSFGDILLSYLSSKPVRQMSKIKIKISRQIKARLKQSMLKINKNDLEAKTLFYIKKIRDAGIGEITGIIPEIRESEMNKFNFNGNVYLLIGVRTFSSAVLFASAIKDHNIGVIIGSETGAPASHFGDIFSFKLPNTKLSVKVSYKCFVRPNGNISTKGVFPHFEVSDINVNSNKDKIIEFTKNYIKSQRKKI